jgi:hypothetical protein
MTGNVSPVLSSTFIIASLQLNLIFYYATPGTATGQKLSGI